MNWIIALVLVLIVAVVVAGCKQKKASTAPPRHRATAPAAEPAFEDHNTLYQQGIALISPYMPLHNVKPKDSRTASQPTTVGDLKK